MMTHPISRIPASSNSIEKPTDTTLLTLKQTIEKELATIIIKFENTYYAISDLTYTTTRKVYEGDLHRHSHELKRNLRTLESLQQTLESFEVELAM